MSGETSRAYHEATNHLEGFVPPPRHVDGALIPRPYKLYHDLPPIPLPEPHATNVLNFEALSTLLKYSNGIVRQRTVNGVERAYRAASCTGGAYHIEAYVVTAALPGLDAGVYHYGPQDHALRRLRRGDYRRSLAEAAALDRTPKAFVVLTSVFYGNAWRYEDRAYRHVFWDAGTVLANLEAVATAHGLPATACVAFVDAAVEHLLGLEPSKELTVWVVALGSAVDTPPSPDASPLDHALVPASRIEIEYPRIAQTHAAGAIATAQEVIEWRKTHGTRGMAESPPSRVEPIESIIERRTSARRFLPEPISLGELRSLLDAAHAPLPFDVVSATTETRVIAHAVADLDPGAYAYDSSTRTFATIALGDLRGTSTHLALDQPLAGDAAANLYFMSDLDNVLQTHGDRGYRLAQLEAGLRGGRVYLEATALNLQATGLTFYDDAVSRLLSSDGELAPMFLIAIGR